MQRSKAFAEQLAQLGGGAHALATYLLGNRDDAADAVHDAIVNALRRPHAYNPEQGALKPWFLSVVRHRCIDLLRRRRPADHQVEVLPDPRPTPDRAAQTDQSLALIDAALNRLPDAQREILVLRDVNDLNYAEIADMLTIPKGTVMSRLHRARLALRRALDDMEEASYGQD
ncbi:MAG: sigma-70 family RNA polymerase sigma factor [Pseudomonadota bacterium]